MRNKLVILCLCLLLFACEKTQPAGRQDLADTPLSLAQKALEKDLAFARPSFPAPEGKWPRTLSFVYVSKNWKTGETVQETRELTLLAQPKRIVAHSVGVTEILWAIVPRERIVGFHQLCAESENSVLSEEFQKRGPFFSASETEKVISWKPDLVFTVSYSDPAFERALQNAGIRTWNLGYFAEIESLTGQILFLGECLGEEENAKALVAKIQSYTFQLHEKFSSLQKMRLLDYSSFNTVSGSSSTFQNLCDILGAINIGKEAGFTSFQTVEAEWLLKQNPPFIVFSSKAVKEKLQRNPILRELEAVKLNHLIYLEPKYLTAISQYLLASAHRLAEKIIGQ